MLLRYSRPPAQACTFRACNHAPNALERSDEHYSLSPNLSLMSASIADMASASSAPLVSSSTVVPLLAASIITPMMLFALTRRLARAIHTSLVKRLAVCVSFAEARACRPGLLIISSSCLSMLVSGILEWHSHNTFRAAGKHFFNQLGKRDPTAIVECAKQHRQVHSCHTFDVSGIQHLAGDVRWGGAVHVGQHQHPFAFVEEANQVARLRQDRVGIVMRGDTELAQQ